MDHQPGMDPFHRMREGADTTRARAVEHVAERLLVEVGSETSSMIILSDRSEGLVVEVTARRWSRYLVDRLPVLEEGVRRVIRREMPDAALTVYVHP